MKALAVIAAVVSGVYLSRELYRGLKYINDDYDELTHKPDSWAVGE